MRSDSSPDEIDQKKLRRIREQVLKAEKQQLHMRKPHNIIPKIQGIIEEEITE
jgi:hypothetical protein